MKRILFFIMYTLLSVGAWAVNDISLSVVKAGMSPNWAASVSDENVVTLNCGGAVEWVLFPGISTANYTGVEVVFATAPIIAEGQSVSLSVYYEGEDEAVSTTYESGTTLSATFAADKKVSMVALSTGWSEQDALHATFTLASATIKGASGAATAPSANLSLPFGKIAAPAGWGLEIPEGTQDLTISQYSSAGWTFTTAVNTTDYSGINLTLTQAPANGGSITIKYDGADDQTISVNASTTSVVADFEQSGTVTGIYFNGDGWHDPDNTEDQPLGKLTYGIGNCYLVVKTSTPPSSDGTYAVNIASDIANGTIVADCASADAGTTVTLTVTPDEGYQLLQLTVETVANASQANSRKQDPAIGIGTFITTQRQGDDTWTFTMPAFSVLVSAQFVEMAQKPTVAYAQATRTITITNTGSTTDGTLHYILNNGTEQTATDDVTVVITENTAVKAWVEATDKANSEEVTETFCVAAKPTVAYTDGANKVSLSLTAATETNTADATLYYTTDGSEPTTNSAQLSADGDIDIEEGMTIVKVLALDADGNYSETVEQSVEYAYYLTASQQWTTYYSPKTFTVPAGLKAYTVTSLTVPANGESGTVEVTEQQVIAKNTPMLILNENAGTTDKYRVTATADQTIAGVASEYKGVDADTELTNDGKPRYVLVDGVFLRTLEGTLPAYHCYLELENAAQARRFYIVVDGTTTAIAPVSVATQGQASWYDLRGQRVTRLQKGIYVKDGKKVVVK